jgi:hypothetical protein
MRKLTILLAVLLASLSQAAETAFYGMFVNGKRIGSIVLTAADEEAGLRRSLSTTKVGAAVLGEKMLLEVRAESLVRKGILEKQSFRIESAGRLQIVTADFSAKEVRVSRLSEGNTFSKVLPVPEGAVFSDDPTTSILGKAPKLGGVTDFYTFDPMTLTLIKNQAEYLGEKSVDIDGKTIRAVHVVIKDPRANTDMYLTPAGDLLLASTLFGITLKPISREEALGGSQYSPEVDLAGVSRNVPDKPIKNQYNLRALKLELSGKSIPRIKNDGYFQNLTRLDSTRAILLISPPEPRTSPIPLTQLRLTQAKYVGPALNLPSDDPQFREIAVKALNGEKDGWHAALRLARYVKEIMTPKASVGMLRDAREIWRTKEGVCRDYATLAATLMRAAGIPTKLVTGAVYADGAFYYHAWIEVWDGRTWMALDPTLNGGLADPTHIKFVEGDPETAFVTFVLDGIKIKVLEQIERGPARHAA